MTDDHDRSGAEAEPVGTLAEEGARLFAALGDWARDQGSDLGAGVAAAAGQAAEAARQVDDHLATGSAECTFCPVCRTVHAMRQTTPEVRAQLVVAANALLQAGSGLLASLAASQGSTPRPGPRGPGPSVERIDLDDDGRVEDPSDEPADDASSSEKHDGWEA